VHKQLRRVHCHGTELVGPFSDSHPLHDGRYLIRDVHVDPFRKTSQI
jgi:hypothetical protein